MRHLGADAGEVVEGEVDLRLAGDREEVQHGVGRSAERHDHGDGVEFCKGSIKVKAEAIGRSAEVKHEDGDSDDVSDYGFYATIFYGLDEMTTISARHGYVSELAELELEDRNRTSLAISRNLSSNVLARLQYDYNSSDSIEGEHALWLQFKIAIGGSVDCHSGCNH